MQRVNTRCDFEQNSVFNKRNCFPSLHKSGFPAPFHHREPGFTHPIIHPGTLPLTAEKLRKFCCNFARIIVQRGSVLSAHGSIRTGTNCSFCAWVYVHALWLKSIRQEHHRWACPEPPPHMSLSVRRALHSCLRWRNGFKSPSLIACYRPWRPVITAAKPLFS